MSSMRLGGGVLVYVIGWPTPAQVRVGSLVGEETTLLPHFMYFLAALFLVFRA